MPELEIGVIITEGMQTRAVAFDEATVEEYCDQMFEGAEFPPLEVAQVKDKFYLWDGFHRFEAYCRLERRKVSVNITKVASKEAALELALGANQKHGLRLTNADKRHKVVLALKMWPKISNREIARKTGVSDVTVGAVLKTLSAKVLQIEGEDTSGEEDVSGKLYQIEGENEDDNQESSNPAPTAPTKPSAPSTTNKATTSNTAAPTSPSQPAQQPEDDLKGIPQHLQAKWKEVLEKGGTPKIAYRDGKSYVIDTSKKKEEKTADPQAEAQALYERQLKEVSKILLGISVEVAKRRIPFDPKSQPLSFHLYEMAAFIQEYGMEVLEKNPHPLLMSSENTRPKAKA